MRSLFYSSRCSSRSEALDKVFDVAHIKAGALVEFVAEKHPEKSEEPVIKANAFWQLEEP